MDVDLIHREWLAFQSAPELFIVWGVVIAWAVWFLRRSVDGGTIAALRERIEVAREREGIARELQQIAEGNVMKLEAEVKKARSTTPALLTRDVWDNLESTTATASTSVASIGKIFRDDDEVKLGNLRRYGHEPWRRKSDED